MSRPFVIAAGLFLVLSMSARGADGAFTRDFRIEDCRFAASGDNPYFSLEPGHRLVLTGEDDGEEVVLEITVLPKKRTISFTTARGRQMRVEARVVEERETVDGELVEVSRNYFARCAPTNDVFYFGEAVDNYEDGEIVNHDGAWLAGMAGAQPGVIMPGTYLLGARYFQEMAPGAMDRGENTAMGLTMQTGAGTFRNCVEVIETSPLEPGHESLKRYCPGVGMVVDGDLVLEEIGDGDD